MPRNSRTRQHAAITGGTCETVFVAGMGIPQARVEGQAMLVVRAGRCQLPTSKSLKRLGVKQRSAGFGRVRGLAKPGLMVDVARAFVVFKHFERHFAAAEFSRLAFDRR